VLETINLSEREGVLVRGPAKIVVSKGTVEVLGKMCEIGQELVLSYGKTYPLHALSTTELELYLGSSSECVKGGERLVPPEWNDLANLLMDSENKVALILGDADTGKSSLVLYTANQLSAAGYPTAVVDTDIGQSDVGPPGVIGLGLVTSPTLALMETPLVTGYFIGDKNPSGHFLAMMLGTQRMVDEAMKTEAKAILIDTTGMVHGGPARALKEKKVEAVSPDIIVALQREREIEHLLVPLKGRFRILRLPVPTTMKRTGRRERIALRGFAMRKHIKGMEKLALNLDRIVLRETFLGTGVVKPELKAELSEILRCEVLHVEEASDTLVAVVKGVYTQEGVSKVREKINKEVRIARTAWLTRLMLGLLAADERLLDVGFLESLSFHNGQLIVSTRLRDEKAVKHVKLGYLRIDEAGNEIGRRMIGVF
jgi:polynucleotide 5'-hydroxyl-kinase GRC3/NOL9